MFPPEGPEHSFAEKVHCIFDVQLQYPESFWTSRVLGHKMALEIHLSLHYPS